MGLSNYIPSSALTKAGVCTSSTRPASPYEGQVIYETDTDMVAVWNGSSWRYFSASNTSLGSVLQVAFATPSVGHASTTSSTYVDSGYAVSITPKSSTSKIVGFFNASMTVDNESGALIATAYRNGVDIGPATYGMAFSRLDGTTALYQPINFQFVDSPTTTSSVEYRVYYRSEVSGQRVYISHVNSYVSFIVMEVAG